MYWYILTISELHKIQKFLINHKEIYLSFKKHESIFSDYFYKCKTKRIGKKIIYIMKRHCTCKWVNHLYTLGGGGAALD